MATAVVRLDDAAPGKQNHLISNCEFELDVNYSPVELLGSGAYGVVVAAKNITAGIMVAIKKINNFENPMVGRCILREALLLRKLSHPNIVTLEHVQAPTSKKPKAAYLVYERMDADLDSIIRSKQTLTNEHHQHFVYQLSCGLKYLHSAGTLHRDLKPANILVNCADCELKISDFGLARTCVEADPDKTQYVVTRYYRAPELLCHCEYDSKVDMWSLGCILAELLGRRPLFLGKDPMDQLKLIVKELGSPAPGDMEWISNPRARKYISELPSEERKDFSKRFPNAAPEAIDLLNNLLQFDPAQRFTADQVLSHPYLEQLSGSVDNDGKKMEVDAPDEVIQTLQELNFGDGAEDGELRRLFWEEAMHYNAHLPPWDE